MRLVRSRALVFGAGYLAGHIGQRLKALGHTTTLSSRRRPSTPETAMLDWVPVDVRDQDELRAVADSVRPEVVVSVHGPSDITWCEDHADQARSVHVGGARGLAEVFPDRRVLAISTDNVFSGNELSYAESDQPEPANAYGMAKLAAEKELLATGNSLALRVSLVYGWDLAGLRPNFFTTCAQRLRTGQPVEVPDDHWNSPVLVSDVAAWTAALLDSEHTGVVHLGGPQRISRLNWARHIAKNCHTDPELVRPVSQRGTTYACRPRNACLHSERANTFAELEGLAPVDVLQASSTLINQGRDRRD